MDFNSLHVFSRIGRRLISKLFIVHIITPHALPPLFTPQVMIGLIPIGILLTFSIGLWRLRPSFRSIHEATSGTPPTELAAAVEAAIDQHPKLKNSPLSSLFDGYKPNVAWWYDVADMARRLMLTCATVVLTDQSSFFLLSLSTAILAVVVHNEVRPMMNQDLNMFVMLEHWLVLLAVLTMVSV